MVSMLHNSFMVGLRLAGAVLCLAVTVSFGVGCVHAADVQWQADQNKLTADLRRLQLGDALKAVGRSMGWTVWIEPGLESRRVSTRFTDLPVSEALRRIMGDLNYALIRGNTVETSKLLVYATHASKATKKLNLSDQVVIFYSKKIDNEIIVQIKPGSPISIEDVAAALGAKIIGKVESLNAYRLSFEDAESADKARERLRDSESVQISDNFEMGRPGENRVYGGGSPSGFSLKAGKANGNEVVVGLIDMPVQGDETLSEFLLPEISLGSDKPGNSGIPSHGTSMAHTVLKGVELGNDGKSESSVRILPVDVYGGDETTSTFQVAQGIYEAINAGASIINLSLGGTETVPLMEQMIREASQQGILFVGAAGNTPTTEPTFPAAYPDVLAVTAATKDGQVAPYANTGDFVDVMVPGRSYIEYNGMTFMINGTSASAAYVSGLAASISANTGRPVREVELELRQSLPKP
jgi:hypothetical protein